jgi:ATP-dependent helicase/nuclease subunit A
MVFGGKSRMSTLISASAGSGKTYALTTEYLRLLHGGQSPESLLAATFTRKAAGEIFDRALSRLASACLEPAACTELADALGNISLTSADCQTLLLSLCGGLDRMAVGTLDGFFARLYARLGPGASLTDPQSPRCVALRQEALRAMLDRLPFEEGTLLLDALNQNKAPHAVLPKFEDLVTGLAETVGDAPLEAWDCLVIPPAPLPEQVTDALQTLMDLRDSMTDKNWIKALTGEIELFQQGAWEGFIAKGIAAKCLLGEASYQRKPITPEIATAYAALLGVARTELLTDLQRRTHAVRDVLTLYSREDRALRDTEGLILFSEAPTRLLPFLQGDGLARLLETSLDHLLLDEFQDTSDRQWSVLQKFVAQAQAASGSVFVVGDVKQAIYGWRGGRAEIFERIATELPEIEHEQRQVSYRSSPVVLNAVNSVFLALAENSALNDYAEARDRWQAHFLPHTAHQIRRGFVELCETPSGEEHEAFCAAAIAETIRAYPPALSVGILVRRNAVATKMADALRALGVDVSSEGTGAVADDPAVELILSALTFADHPGQTAAAFHVAHSPLGDLLQLSSNMHTDPSECAATAQKLRRTLLTYGFADTIADWAAHLAPWGVERTARRLEQLMQFAAEMDALPPMRASEFVQATRDHAAENPGAARVRVMTINRAKGLEFDVVFLPELDWSAFGPPPLCLVRRAAISEPHSVAAIYRYPREALRPLAPELEAAYSAHREEEITTMLCLLYVAMTRARHALHLWVAPAKKALTPANIIRIALAGESEPLPSGAVRLFQSGDESWAMPLTAA